MFPELINIFSLILLQPPYVFLATGPGSPPQVVTTVDFALEILSTVEFCLEITDTVEF